MEILIILLLIVFNGLLAMAEIAIVSARRSKLAQMAEEGSARAKAALELARSPNRFLSTVQIGITLMGILAGVFGGATIADTISARLKSIPSLYPYSDLIAVSLVVIAITYLSLIIGELVPKRVALHSPEKIASLVARPMNTLSSIAYPLVTVLSLSTDWVLSILGIKPKKESPVDAEEVLVIIREGVRLGVFEMMEKEILERTFRLGDKKINSLMTPRKRIVWLDINDSFKNIQLKIGRHHTHSYFPVCEGSLEKVLGVVHTEDLLVDHLKNGILNLNKYLQRAQYISENTDGLEVLEYFKKSGVHMVLVTDKYGSIVGLISISDILEAIVGELPTRDQNNLNLYHNFD